MAERHGVQEGDFLWLVANQQASLMSPADITKALAQRPVSLRFLRGNTTRVAEDLGRNGPLGKAGLLQETKGLQVQQRVLQQLKHKQEQEMHSVHHQSSWLSLIEKQKDEKFSMQKMQHHHLSQLEDSLQTHQELRRAQGPHLPGQEGAGYRTHRPNPDEAGPFGPPAAPVTPSAEVRAEVRAEVKVERKSETTQTEDFEASDWGEKRCKRWE